MQLVEAESPVTGVVWQVRSTVGAAVAAGDVLLLMTDGFPELPDPSGEPLGYAEVRRCFAAVADRGPGEVITALNAAADSWRKNQPLFDDITFVVARKTV